MPTPKIVFVGGGSFAWTPRLFSNILQTPSLDGSTVTLFDLNPDSLDLTTRLATRLAESVDTKVTVDSTTDRAAALDGADFVVVTITTGGLAAMVHDLEIPERYGIFQTVGDTVGPGGLMRALRNVPVFLNIAQAMEKACPSAWILNCSNPLSALTRVITRETPIRTVGVCHGVREVARQFAGHFDKPLSECAFTNAGIDHCAWFTRFQIDGRPALDLLLEQGISKWLAMPADEAEKDPLFGDLFGVRCGIELGLNLNALPAIQDRHLVEFFPGYINSEDTIAERGLVRTSIADREANGAAARKRIERILASKEAPDPFQTNDDVAGWIAALSGGPFLEDNLNAVNRGQVPQLPEGAVVETRGILDGAGEHPLVSPLPHQLEAIVRPHALREELTVDAALEGSVDKALAVVTSDPLLSDTRHARPMLDEMLAATNQWLPRFQ